MIIQRMQTPAYQIHVVQSRNNGEGKGRPQERLLGYPDPLYVVHLEQHYEDHGRELGKSIRFSENAGTEVAQAGNGVEHLKAVEQPLT